MLGERRRVTLRKVNVLEEPRGQMMWNKNLKSKPRRVVDLAISVLG